MHVHRGQRIAGLGLLLLLLARPAPAQRAAPAQAPEPLQERHLLRDIGREQKRIWTSPLHLSRRQLPLLLLAGTITAGLIASDRHTSAALPETGALVRGSRVASNLGIGALLASAGGLYLYGWRGRAPPAREHGLAALESVANAALAVEVVKLAARRERPLTGSGDGHFWAGGNSFPSGHAALGWAVAESLADSYPNHAWVRWSAWSTATAVSVLRVTGQKHFPSDVFAGALIGALIGHDVTVHAARVTMQPLFEATPQGLSMGVGVSF